MADVRKGLIIVNTGPGKGKTTAAMGTALRAVGQGMKVLMLQFLKGSWHYGELDAVQAFGDRFVMKQMGRGFVKVGGAETDPEDIRIRTSHPISPSSVPNSACRHARARTDASAR